MNAIGDSSEINLKIIDAEYSDDIKATLIELLDWEKKRLDKDHLRYKEDYRKVLSKHVSTEVTGR